MRTSYKKTANFLTKNLGGIESQRLKHSNMRVASISPNSPAGLLLRHMPTDGAIIGDVARVFSNAEMTEAQSNQMLDYMVRDELIVRDDAGRILLTRLGEDVTAYLNLINDIAETYRAGSVLPDYWGLSTEADRSEVGRFR